MKITIRTGTRVMPRTEENATERVFVHAKGRNMKYEQLKENGWTNLLRGGHQNAPPFFLGQLASRRACAGNVLRQMPVAIFDHDDRCVDEHSDRQRQSTKRHNVGTDVQEVHRYEGRKNRDG